MTVNRANKTVAIHIQAGKTAANNHWNFNGSTNGSTIISVPVNYSVEIGFKNDDRAVAHSLGVDARTGEFPPHPSRSRTRVPWRHQQQPDRSRFRPSAGKNGNSNLQSNCPRSLQPGLLHAGPRCRRNVDAIRCHAGYNRRRAGVPATVTVVTAGAESTAYASQTVD